MSSTGNAAAAPHYTMRLTDDRNKNVQKAVIAEFLSGKNNQIKGKTAVQYADYIMQAAKKYNQDPFIITALVVHESTARRDAVSKGGDYGLMQVRWSVHQKNITKQYPHIKNAKDMFDPKYNVLVGTEILANYMKKAGDIRGGLLRYSAGNTALANKVLHSAAGIEKSYRNRMGTKHDAKHSQMLKK